jgi:hypothetical protein
MVVHMLAAALGAIGASGGTSAATVSSTFARYCAAASDRGSIAPYCVDSVPENVQWLVLRSLCASDVARVPPNDAICRDLDDADARATRERRFLVYSPHTDRWTAIVYRKGAAGAYVRASDDAWATVDETGVATITRAPSDDVPVLIEGVNPLVYGTTPETVTSDDIDSLASLQALAAGLGSALDAAIAAAAQGGFAAMARPRAAGGEPSSPLAEVVRRYEASLRELAAAAADVARLVARLEIERAQAIASIQDVEYRTAAAAALTVTTDRAWPSNTVSGAALDAPMERMESAYQAVTAFGLGCQPLLADFANLLQHASDAEADIAPALAAFVRAHRTPGDCDHVFARLALAIVDDALALCAAARADGVELSCPGGDAGSPDTFAALMKSTRTKYAGRLALLLAPPAKTGSGPAPMDAALALLTVRRADAVATLHTMLNAAARRSRYAFDGRTTMTWLYVPPKTDRLPWNARQTHVFSLKPDAPLADQVIAAYPDERRLRYQVQSRRSAAIGVGVGVVYTGLTQPSWDAVSDPRDPGRKVVSRTDSTTRAGQLAIFADWRLASVLNARAEEWRIRPSLQAGTNATATAGFFAGAGVDLFQYVRLGVGRTWQQSKRLNGQVEGVTVVSSRDDIRLEDVFESGWYASFSFAVDALPIFKRSAK